MTALAIAALTSAAIALLVRWRHRRRLVRDDALRVSQAWLDEHHRQ